MNILFVFSNLERNCGANMNIGLTLAGRMKAEHTVDAVVGYGRDSYDEEKASIFGKIYPVNLDEDDLLDAFLEKSNWKSKSSFGKICLMLTHLKEFVRYIDVLQRLYFESSKILRKAVEKACGEKQYDAVIGIVFPFSTAMAISKAKLRKTKKFVLMLDPFYSNRVIKRPGKAVRGWLEKGVGNRVDRIFTTDLIINEAPCKNPGLYVPVDFPEIIVGAERPADTHRVGDTIECTYVGGFYEDIRNPEYLLKLFTKLPPKYVLNIVGGGCESILEEYKNVLGERLKLHGVVSSEEAAEMRNKADVLVNVNSTLPNQVSSKLFEYFETGKPILNICKIIDCPSLKYTEKYVNAINIFEKDDFDYSSDVIQDNIDKMIRNVVSHLEIERIFYANTDECVCRQVIKEIE